MNSETMMYMPVYDSFGNLCTQVYEKNNEYISTLPPTKLLDFNLRYFGSSLRGAFDGSKMILGKLNKILSSCMSVVIFYGFLVGLLYTLTVSGSLFII